MPLCSKGLWLAEMTMPASAPLRTVRYATAGVGSTPKGITSPPTEQMQLDGQILAHDSADAVGAK